MLSSSAPSIHGTTSLTRQPPRQHPVGPVDHHRGQEEPQHGADLALVGEVHHQQGQHHACGR